MNSVILCEGRTDAIILSYYLEKTAGWSFTRKSPKGIKITAENDNQEVNWYKKNEDFLMIYGVGGKDNFEYIYNNYIKDIIFNYDDNLGFSKLVLLRDKDENSIEELIEINNSILRFKTKNQEWVTCKYEDEFGAQQHIEVLSIIIPNDNQGALENVLLSSISENLYDKNIVDKSNDFIDSFNREADEYIGTDRLKTKAKLSTVLSVISPERTFVRIDGILKSVKWEEYNIIDDNFGILKQI